MAVAAATALLLVAGCREMFGPDRAVRPQMRALEIPYLSLTSGIMRVDGFPADTAFRLEVRQSVPIEITVSSGDRESTALYPAFCPPRPEGRFYVCFEFDIGMQPGYDILSLNDYVAGIGGRMQFVNIFHTWGHVVLFDPSEVVSRARKALSWPGVRYVELGGLGGCAADGSSCVVDWSRVTRPVYVTTGAARPDDGIVEMQPGDTVTVTYRQPDGSTVQTQVQVIPGP
jgi:hypothetical protein